MIRRSIRSRSSRCIRSRRISSSNRIRIRIILSSGMSGRIVGSMCCVLVVVSVVVAAVVVAVDVWVV